jgi:hypothetical protein
VVSSGLGAGAGDSVHRAIYVHWNASLRNGAWSVKRIVIITLIDNFYQCV